MKHFYSVKNILLIVIMLSFFSSFSQETKTIYFKSGNFIPKRTNLSESTFFANELVGDNYYRIIQFAEIPTQAQKEILATNGITLLDYLPDFSFYAAINKNTDLNVLSSYKVVSVLSISTQFKLTRLLDEKNYPEWTLFGIDQIELNTMYFPTVAKTTAESKLKSLGAEITMSNDANIIRFRIPLNKVEVVYSQPEFYYFEQLDEPQEPENFRARTSHRSNTIATNYVGGLNFDGSGMTVMMQDDGIIGPHIDYQGRIDQRVTTDGGNHGDHVSGTIMGAGNLDPKGKGMAFGADLLVYSSSNNNYNDVPTLYNNEDVVITSKSYSNGCNAGYTTLARQLDQQSRTLPALIHVFSAGNSGTSDCSYGAGAGWGNLTGGHKAGKNVVAVGNLSYIDGLSGSSSRGPAEDGRIKPDVCAVGTSVFSTMDVNSYQTISGTSMACPGVAGVFTQLYHAYKTLNSGNNPDNALMKAAVLNTADDLGNAGPDFKHGWGRINARRAYELLSNNNYLSSTISQGGNNTHQITVPANTVQVRIMILWTDYEGSTTATKALVNDINMQVVDPSTTTFNPWVLDPTPTVTSLDALATRGIDDLNNMEQVTIDNPTVGTYTINVNGFAIPQGPQEYYIVYEFVTDEVVVTYPIGGEGFAPGTTETIRWDAFGNSGNFAIEYSIDNGVSWSPINMNYPSTLRHFNWSVPNTLSGLAKVRVTRGANSDESDQVFSIIGTPNNLNVGWACPDSLNFTWNAVPGATGYEVHMLGNKYMDSVGVSTTTNIVLAVQSTDTVWLSVRALGPDDARGERAVAIQKLPGTFACPIPVDVNISNPTPQDNQSILACMTSSFVLEVDVKNEGLNSLSNIPVHYKLNGGATVSENITGPVSPGATVSYTFTTSPSPISGNNSLLIWSDITGDGNSLNDSVSIQFNYNTAAPKTLPWSEDFETFTLCSTASDCEIEVCNTNNDFINLTNGVEDDIDWRTNRGATPSSGTGPSMDYNPGTSLGKYMYLEASGAPVCSNKSANLITPCIDLVGTNNPTLSFAYNMNGISMGALMIDVYSNGTWTSNVMTPLVGNKGTSWLTQTVSLNAFVGNVINVRFRGVTGNNWESDLAIDDISITQTVGINENVFGNISIYPNPAQNNLIIDGIINNEGVDLSITDITGKAIVNYSSTSNNNQKLINISELSSGVYFIKLNKEGATQTLKFVKQ
ncbi:MAG: hypothetical protein CMD31_10395 [Flavobacteriales bacterium]|jgi:subtilisin family serine protease|nr:hypothetical protein [Flavobacteriales bacterium]|tara:strand:+ start:4184 stop:7783 length:3600 start_codon:yes stop_codon:yes gene_type:complete